VRYTSPYEKNAQGNRVKAVTCRNESDNVILGIQIDDEYHEFNGADDDIQSLTEAGLDIDQANQVRSWLTSTELVSASEVSAFFNSSTQSQNSDIPTMWLSYGSQSNEQSLAMLSYTEATVNNTFRNRLFQSRMGWGNIDKLMKQRYVKDVDLTVQIEGLPEDDFAEVAIILANRRVYLQAYGRDYKTYKFSHNDNVPALLPKGIKGLLICNNKVGEEHFYTEKEIIIGYKKIETLTPVLHSEKEIQKKLEAIL
jgi:hypothetical protein